MSQLDECDERVRAAWKQIRLQDARIIAVTAENVKLRAVADAAYEYHEDSRETYLSDNSDSYHALTEALIATGHIPFGYDAEGKPT